jgi:hypothetical protein
MFLNVPSIAPIPSHEVRQIRITHPFHPMSGQQFDLVEHRCIFAESFVYFHDSDGHLREIPSAWTDSVKGDAFVEMASGRSQLHAGCLLELVDLIDRLGKVRAHGM